MKRRTFLKLAGSVAAATVLNLGLVACDKTTDDANGGSGGNASTTTLPEPAANIDPSAILPGFYGPDGGRGSETWFGDYGASKDGIFFTETMNAAGLSVSWVDANDQETAQAFDDVTIEDGHLKGANDAGAAFDIVFIDPMTCYDYETETYYLRGDLEARRAIVLGKTFLCEETGRTYTFNEDGTSVSVSRTGSSTEGTWEAATAKHIIVYKDNGDIDEVFLPSDDGTILTNTMDYKYALTDE